MKDIDTSSKQLWEGRSGGKAVLFTTPNPKLKIWNSICLLCCSIATASLFIFMSIAKEISGLNWILQQHVDIQTDTNRDAHVSGGGETKHVQQEMTKSNGRISKSATKMLR